MSSTLPALLSLTLQGHKAEATSWQTEAVDHGHGRGEFWLMFKNGADLVAQMIVNGFENMVHNGLWWFGMVS